MKKLIACVAMSVLGACASYEFSQMTWKSTPPSKSALAVNDRQISWNDESGKRIAVSVKEGISIEDFGNGFMGFRSGSSGKSLGGLLVAENGAWIFYTFDFRYDCSEDAAKHFQCFFRANFTGAYDLRPLEDYTKMRVPGLLAKTLAE